MADPEEASSTPNFGEVVDEIGNPFSFNGLSIENPSDMMAYKRHMGAIAALSGSRQFSGGKSFVPPSKKHLGSIAAAAQPMGRTPAGRKLDLILPAKAELYKRHLGALMALSGTKQRPLTRSLKNLSGYQMDSQADTDDLGTPPMSFTRGNIMGAGGHGMVSDPDIMNPDEIQSSAPVSLAEYVDELSSPSSSESGFQQMKNTEILNPSMGSEVDVGAYKSKRFLGKAKMSSGNKAIKLTSKVYVLCI